MDNDNVVPINEVDRVVDRMMEVYKQDAVDGFMTAGGVLQLYDILSELPADDMVPAIDKFESLTRKD